MEKRLFPSSLPQREWSEFPASGFRNRVSGAIFNDADPPCCGVPLGGIDTGCIDLDARGVYGFNSIFNAFSTSCEPGMKRAPRKDPVIHPLLGVAAEGQVWLLANERMLSGSEVAWCTEPRHVGPSRPLERPIHLKAAKVHGVVPARRIEYWGHYPLVDMEVEWDGPLTAGLRAWAPFIPGDLAASNTPAAVFEVHLRNLLSRRITATVAMHFPGPDPAEARAVEFTRERRQEDFDGMLVQSLGGVGYVLGALGGEAAGFGCGLCSTPDDWRAIADRLPQPVFRESGASRWYDDGSCSVSVRLDVGPGAQAVARFLLAWHAPVWEGAEDDPVIAQIFEPQWQASRWASRQNRYTHMYASRYENALDVARRVAAEHGDLLRRVLAWQDAVYGEQRLPPWLRDSLVNVLSTVPETSCWAQPRPPLGDWAFPGGAFAQVESPRGCPHTSCNPCSWWSGFPYVFFFPDLARQELRGFKHYQKRDGEVPFALGRVGDLPDPATPEYYWQVSLNGPAYVDMVSRLWEATGDREVLREFYESIRRSTIFTMLLNSSPEGVISLAERGGMEWFEAGEWAGMTSHIGGLRLASLRMAERMAAEAGDTDFVRRCREWFEAGSRALETELWAGSHYLNFLDKESGKRSDDVMAYQLDGEWAARLHGLGGVFNPQRVAVTLETIRKCNVALTPDTGAASFCRPDGTPLPAASPVAAYGQYSVFPEFVVGIAMNYLYAGQEAFGLELMRRTWENEGLRQGHYWDHANLVDGKDGRRISGTDYVMALSLWALPGAALGQDLRALCAPGGFVEGILRAGRRSR